MNRLNAVSRCAARAWILRYNAYGVNRRGRADRRDSRERRFRSGG